MKRLNQLIKDTRGVSEIVGYAASFFIIFFITSMVIISAGPIIDSAESQSTDLPINTNFVYLHDKIIDIQQGVEKKTFETDVPAGELRQLNETEIILNSTEGNEKFSIQTHPLEFVTTQDDTIVYESMFITNSYAGESPENEFVHYQSAESIKSNNQTLRIPSLSYSEQRSISSSTRSRLVRFEMERIENERSERFKSFNENVSIEVNSDVPHSWEAYLNENKAFSDVEKNGSEVTAKVETNHGGEFTIITQEINVDFYSS